MFHVLTSGVLVVESRNENVFRIQVQISKIDINEARVFSLKLYRSLLHLCFNSLSARSKTSHLRV